MGLFGNIARSVSRTVRNVAPKVVKGLKRTVPSLRKGIKTSGQRILKGIKSGVNRAGQAIKSAVKKVKGLFKGKPKGTGKLFTEGDQVILKDTVYTPFSQTIRDGKETVKASRQGPMKVLRQGKVSQRQINRMANAKKAQRKSINLLLQN